jgi:hypothetical protein
MKIILNENQLGSLKKTLEDSIDDVGVYQTLKRYNLNLRALSVIFNGDMPEISCQDLYDMIRDQIKVLTSELKIFNNHNFDFEFDRMAGSLQFTCKKLDSESNESLSGWATPYWNGECYIPIDFEFYSWNYDGQELREEDINGDFNHMEDAPTEFNSFNDIKRWLENDYLKMLSERCDEVFEELRKD